MLVEWKKIYPQSDLSEQRLANQKRLIVVNQLQTTLELDLLKQEVLPQSNDNTGLEGTERQSEQILSLAIDQPEEEKHHLSSCLQLVDLSHEEHDMYNDIKNVLNSL